MLLMALSFKTDASTQLPLPGSLQIEIKEWRCISVSYTFFLKSRFFLFLTQELHQSGKDY